MKNVAPQISVLLPVYNGELYLREAIESILNQTFRDFEFIIINDGSSDGSRSIIESYAAQDERIKVFHQDNKGLVATLNRGIALAKSILIARMDADDISLPTRLEKQYNFMQNNLGVVVVGTGMELIDDKSAKMRSIYYPTNAEELKRRFPKECLIAHPSVCMRKDVIQDLGGYRELYKHAEDYDLWLRVFERDSGAIANLPEILLLYRQHDQKISFKYYDQQQLASITARMCYKFRLEHKYDPTANLQKLELKTLNLFKLPLKELNEAFVDMMNAKIRMLSNCSPVTRQAIAGIEKELGALKNVAGSVRSKFHLYSAHAYYVNKFYLSCLFSLSKAFLANPLALSKIVFIWVGRRIKGRILSGMPSV